jgi:hypothetical protein
MHLNLQCGGDLTDGMFVVMPKTVTCLTHTYIRPGSEPIIFPPNEYSLLFFFQLRTAAFKAYCAIWVRRSNFRHQASPRVSPLQSTQRRKVELWARNVREFCLNVDFQVTFRDLLHAVKLRHGTDGFTSPPKEGVLRIFFALKIRRLRPDVNPRTCVPKASTLHLDPRSR